MGGGNQKKLKSLLRQLNLDGACLYHWELMNVTMSTMVGEWSLAITDCQLYLQGGFNEPYHPGTGAEVAFRVFFVHTYTLLLFQVCARYPSDFANYAEDYKDFLAKFMLAQMDSFEFGDQVNSFIHLHVFGSVEVDPREELES